MMADPPVDDASTAEITTVDTVAAALRLPEAMLRTRIGAAGASRSTGDGTAFGSRMGQSPANIGLPGSRTPRDRRSR
jgi:hypothetical protein